MKNAPCKNCEDHKFLCTLSCEKFLEWKDKKHAAEAERKKYLNSLKRSPAYLERNARFKKLRGK